MPDIQLVLTRVMLSDSFTSVIGIFLGMSLLFFIVANLNRAIRFPPGDDTDQGPAPELPIKETIIEEAGVYTRTLITRNPNPLFHHEPIRVNTKLPKKCPACGAGTIETFHGKDGREACIYCGTVLSE